jgi:hypothetical protein
LRCGEKGFAGDAGTGRKQAHQREREHGLAASGFANQAEGFTGSDVQGDIADRTHPALSGGQFDSDAAKIEKRGHISIIFGSVQCNGKKCSCGAIEIDA